MELELRLKEAVGIPYQVGLVLILRGMKLFTLMTLIMHPSHR